jgi:AraC-like DNA-binding protein
MLEDLKLADAYDGFIFLAEAKRNPPILKPHRHRELELNLVVEGSITYVVGRQRYTFHQGTQLWMFPAQEHQLVDRTADARYYVAVFKPSLIAQISAGERYAGLRRGKVPSGGGVLARTLAPEAFFHIRKTMESLMVDALDPDRLNREAGFGYNSPFRYEHHDPSILNAGLRYLLVHCWRMHRTGSEAFDAVQLHPCVDRALNILSSGELDIDLGELASRSGASPAYLSRLFRRQVGVPVNRYRSSVRLSRFMTVLNGPVERTLMEAAYEVGFGSYAQFYKVFKEAYGHGPREFLRASPNG